MAARRRLASLLAGAVSTDLAAVSDSAADSAFGSRGATAARLMPAIDLEPFLHVAEERAARVGEPPVILHIGRFEAEKNHDFILDIASAAKVRQCPWQFVLVGAGSLRDHVDARVQLEGLNNVSLLQPRDDVLELFAGAHVFILPSLYEGLGLVALEAQASGVPTLISSGVPNEAMLRGAPIWRLDNLIAADWVGAIERSLASARPDVGALREGAEASGISLRQSVRALLSVYDWTPEETDESTLR